MGNKKYTIDYIKKNNLILLDAISGSRAYNTHIEGVSDTDYRGIFIAELDDYLCGDFPEQISDETNDMTYYEIGRFFELLIKNNPNILELLNVPEDCVNFRHELVSLINSNDYVSKLCKNSIGGYATSQIKKARGLGKKIVTPIDEVRKTPLDFCNVIDGHKSMPLQKLMDEKGMENLFCGVVDVPNARDTYALYYDWQSHYCFSEKIDKKTREAHKSAKKEYGEAMGLGYKGLMSLDSNTLRLSSIPKKESDNVICNFSYNKDSYTQHCKAYKEYWDWVEKRNPERYKVAAKSQYDCYKESDTEFLTKGGWKKFDDIKGGELVATINHANNSFEWQKPYDKFDDLYTGDLYTYENSHTRFSVTSNHNLYFANCNRGPKTGYSTKYNKENSGWYLQSAESYFKTRRSYKHVLTSAEANYNTDYDVSDDMIKLIGSYVSEGSFIVKNKKVVGLSISQLEGGRLCEVMEGISGIEYSTNSHNRKGRNELTYAVREKEVVEFVSNNCGRYSNQKRLPDYVYEFSTRQFDLLLISMIAGDGHSHTKGHVVYYTTSKEMADQLQSLLVMHGYNHQLYGPYKKEGKLDMYQVFISKEKDRNTTLINKRAINKNGHKLGWDIQPVVDERIVCFSVGNSILITRNKNKVAIQGNCKNMMHCYRLAEMGIEIAEGKGIIVRRPNREFLLKIRNGEMSYDQILDLSEDLLNKSDEAFKKSDIRKTPNVFKAKETEVEIRKRFYGIEKGGRLFYVTWARVFKKFFN